MFHLKISQKLLILFLLVSLLPLFAVNFLFLQAVQNHLKQAASDKQNLLVQNSTQRVDSFIGEKITALIIHSQTSAIQQLTLPEAEQELQQIVKEDSSITKVALVDPSGMERVVVDHNGNLGKLTNIAAVDAFRAATFVSGKEYIGPVNYDSNNKPQVTIAVPNLTFTARQRLLDLSTAESGVIRSASDIKGVLIATVSLSDLWNSVLSSKLGDNGYAYVVDDKGFIIAYPNQSQPILKDASSVAEVALFLRQQTPIDKQQSSSTHNTISEQGVPVLSSHLVVPRTGWAVIVEQPLASVYADSKRLSGIDTIMSAVAALASIILSLLFSRSLLRPIRELRDGAARIGRGELSYKLPATGRDELGSLAKTFNDMATSLAVFVKRFKDENLRLESEKNKLQVVLNSISEGVVAIDGNGKIVLSNSIATQLISPNLPIELPGLVLSEIFHLSDAKGQAATLMLPNEGITAYTDLVMQLPNDERRFFNLLIARIVGDVSGIQGIITIRDITKDRELEVLKLDFVSIAAHELRTPITAIRGYLEFLEGTTTKLSESDHTNLARATAAATSLSGLVTNLLNVAKIERGTFETESTPLDLTNLVADATKDNQFAAAAKKLQLNYEGPSDGIFVSGDDASLREVINNLLSNAINYTERGSITVRASSDGKTASVSVTDTGRGIPKSSLDKLFTKFYRVRGRLETGSQGSGLGLYLAKSIIEKHNGSLVVESQEGKGTTFTFNLPITDKPTMITDRANSGNKNGWTTKRITR